MCTAKPLKEVNINTNQGLKESNHYATHLSIVNKVNTVTARENIYNHLGVLIVAKGAEIDTHAYQQIIKHKLKKPIENSIVLENTLTPDKLSSQFTSLTASSELKNILCEKLDITQFAVHYQHIQEYPLLLQKLTVLQSRFPIHYRTTIYGALLSLYLCYEQNLSYDVSNNTFLAALFRDLGLLHIDPMVVEENGKLNAQAWMLLQGHVAIGYNIAKLTPGLPDSIAKAVLEHHETTDGFGYPFSKMENKLSLEGQIVGFADTFIALFQKHIFGFGRSISELESILKINAGVNLHQNTQSALRLIRTYIAPINTTKNNNRTIRLAEKLLSKQPGVSVWFDNALHFNEQLAAKYPNNSLQKTTKFIARQQDILLRSGITDVLLLQWLKSLDLNHLSTQDAIEIEKSWLMLNEVSWQFDQLIKNFQKIVSELKLPDEKLVFLHTKIDLLQESLNLLICKK